MNRTSAYGALGQAGGSAALLLVLAVVLLLRCLRGLDLSDEMQYYGQIDSLVRHGRLFASDLFFQQAVYVPFYPLFKLHHWLFGDEGLVLFGRGVLAALLLALYVYARRAFEAGGTPGLRAGLAAAGLTFCVPYHGVFALSYNTLSQLAWAVFMFWFWRRSIGGGAWRWGILVVLCSLSHPVAGLVMAALLSARLAAERRWAFLGRCLAWMAAAAAVLLLCLLNFASIDQLTESLEFSKGFGAGVAWIGSPVEFRNGLTFIAVLLSTLWLPAAWLRNVPTRVILALGLAAGSTYLALVDQPYGYTPNVFYLGATITVLALTNRVASVIGEDARVIRWGTIAIAAHFLSLVVTSSNGIGQGIGAAWLAIPFLIGTWGVASNLPTNAFGPHSDRVGALVASLALVFLATHWTKNPYRDLPWYRSGDAIAGVPAFRFVGASPEHADVIDSFRRHLASTTENLPTLIVSNYPALYFALGARPATCMLYTHSLPQGRAADVLMRCMDGKAPAAVLFATQPGGGTILPPKPVLGYFARLATSWGLTACVDRQVPMPGIKWIGAASQVGAFRYCQART